MVPLSSLAPTPKRKRSRKPSSLSPDLSTSSPTGLRYPSQLLHQARTGYTPLLSIATLHTSFLRSHTLLTSTLSSISLPSSSSGAELSTAGLGVDTPWQVIARRMDEEVASVAAYMRDKESDARAEEERQRKEQRRLLDEAKQREKARAQEHRKRRIPKFPKRQRTASPSNAAADASERKDESPITAVKDEEEEKADEEEKAPPKPPGLRSMPLFSASLSAVSTSTSPLNLSATLPLPDGFGCSMPSYAALVNALVPPPELPLSLFPSVVDHNTVTNELFLHRLHKKLEEAKDHPPPAPLPTHTPLLHVSVYASCSERKQQELILHSGQPLSALTTAVRCPHTPSNAFLYLERTLYTDDPATVAPVLDFLTAHPEHPLYPSTTAPLSSTTFHSLSLRVGSHYLYHHGSDCCHVVLFTQVSFLDPAWDLDDPRLYPLEPYVRNERKRKCGGCRLFGAQYAVYDDLLCADNPTFLCDQCYRRLHYDHDGRLLYADFTVYRV